MMTAVSSIEGGLAVDDRGSLRFINDFDPTRYNVRRFYQVENHASDFIRAWHGHEREGKFVYVVRGSIVLGVCKMENKQMLVNEHTKMVLTDSKPKTVYIPPGNANGFKTLTPNAIVMFFSTSTLEESKGDDIRFAWNIIPFFWENDFR